jgi:hypothetical protein
MKATWKGVVYEVVDGPRWRVAGGDWERVPLEVEPEVYAALVCGAADTVILRWPEIVGAMGLRGWTLEGLADEVGVPLAQMCWWAGGRDPIPYESRVRLARALYGGGK